jgi:hypothetical protein
VTGDQRHARRRLHRFMPGARDLEKNLVLALEQDFAIVDAPRKMHDTEGAQQIVAREIGGRLGCGRG